MYVLLFFAVFSAYADMFVEHLDTELGDGDVRGLTSDSKTKAQITVLTSQYHSYFFSLSFTSCDLHSLYFSHFLVAKIGHVTLHQSPGEVWSCWLTERHKPPRFPQTVGDALEGSEPDLQP